MKDGIRRFIQNEIAGWKRIEILWLCITAAIIVGLSIYWRDTVMGVISSTTGVMCVVCTGKGKLSAYIFGLVNSVLYAIIAFEATYYGETMLNGLYYVPMQFIGFYVWSKNINSETHEVNKQHMKSIHRVILFAAIVMATAVYGIFLDKIGDAMPYVDSFTTVSSVIAMIVSVKMYSEQWWIWVMINVASVYMWWVNFATGQDNIATLIMWAVYLCNSVIMLIKWEKEIKDNASKSFLEEGI